MEPSTLRERLDVLLDGRIRPSADIVGALALVAVADVLSIATAVVPPPVRALVGLPVVLFVPGYLLLAIVYPYRDGRDAQSDAAGGSAGAPRRSNLGRSGARSLGWKRRSALSFGLSVALLPLLGLVVGTIAGSLSFEAVLEGMNAFVAVAGIIGIARRNDVPEGRRRSVPNREIRRVAVDVVFGRRSRVDRAITVILMLSVLVATSTAAFAILAPQQGEAYTSTSLLSENADGELVASGYPTELSPGDGADLVLRVENHEGVETTYTVVAKLERVDTSGSSAVVLESEELVRERRTVGAGEAWSMRHTIVPTVTGTDLRMAYYVYEGPPPPEPKQANAYRTVYLWIDVTRSDSAG